MQCPSCHSMLGHFASCETEQMFLDERASRAEYMREWRKTHKMSDTEREHDAARSYLGVYVRRGLVKKLPCAECGSVENVEGHHYDGYDKPLTVHWLCREHHLAVHGNMSNVKQSLHKTEYDPQRHYTVREWVALLQAAS